VGQGRRRASVHANGVLIQRRTAANVDLIIALPTGLGKLNFCRFGREVLFVTIARAWWPLNLEESMMDEISYNLLLRSTQGLTLLGILRYRLLFDDVDGVTRVGGTAALMGQALERPTIGLFVVPAEGSLSIPLITGFRPVPLSGLAFGSIAGVVTVLFGSNNDPRSLGLQINPIDATHIGGGLSWQPGQPGNLIFSVLGTQLALGL
jgi:hypothetical protein